MVQVSAISIVHECNACFQLAVTLLRGWFGFFASPKCVGEQVLEELLACAICIYCCGLEPRKTLFLSTGKKGYAAYSHLFLITVVFFHTGSCRLLVLTGRMMQTNLMWSSQKVYLSCTRENSVKLLLQLDQEITKKDVCILWDCMCMLSKKDNA